MPRLATRAMSSSRSSLPFMRCWSKNWSPTRLMVHSQPPHSCRGGKPGRRWSFGATPADVGVAAGLDAAAAGEAACGTATRGTGGAVWRPAPPCMAGKADACEAGAWQSAGAAGTVPAACARVAKRLFAVIPDSPVEALVRQMRGPAIGGSAHRRRCSRARIVALTASSDDRDFFSRCLSSATCHEVLLRQDQPITTHYAEYDHDPIQIQQHPEQAVRHRPN